METLNSRLTLALARLCGSRWAQQHFCVAFSGGLDSSVLLHALHALRAQVGLQLSAVHIHHGLSPHADDWAVHCEQVCAQWQIPLSTQRVKVPLGQGEGLEAAARRLRHAVFNASSADWVVLAHHRDDQAETLIHHLLRGAGVSGAAGMAPSDAQRRLLRPLLDETRAGLLDYAQANGLHWIEDESNTDTRFTRNFIRQQLMPTLTARFPAAVQKLAQAALHFREADALLSDLAALDLAALSASPLQARARLREMTPARARNCLRGLLAQHMDAMPSAARLEDMLRQLCGQSPVQLSIGGLCIRAWRDGLWTSAATAVQPQPCEWRGEAALQWGSGQVLFEPAIGTGACRILPNEAASLTLRKEGMRLRPRADGPSRSFKSVCQAHGIPPWLRDELPILWQAGEVLWVGGIGVMAAGHCAPQEPGWRLVWRQAPQQDRDP